jgi:hypothetical protein
MTLVDTNVIVDARTKNSPFHDWAEDVLTAGLSGEGISVNAIVLAELCVGVTDPDSVEAEVRAKGLEVADVPAAASVICARAYSRYRLARKKSGGGRAPHIPLPDFFIGAHAELMGWKLATRDTERYRLYFERVELIQPVSK